ncbi:hypothetical protein [Vibrio cyclitrophicus]|uniref:hypothetical protein n=1 Tax=Vibrio cyclitrophicus TaxID=47951 RepID=UPI0011B3A89C|nr:hypothetical protein [Vibrio cyclitrophicus]
MAELLANRTLNITEVKLAPMGLVSEVSKAPVVVLKLGKAVFYAVLPFEYERLKRLAGEYPIKPLKPKS